MFFSQTIAVWVYTQYEAVGMRQPPNRYFAYIA